MSETKSFRPPSSDTPPSSDRKRKIDKEEIGKQLDAFTEKHGLWSIRDRLRIGLNEVGMMAVEDINVLIQDLCRELSKTDEEAETLYGNLVKICVDMQQSGPWEYVDAIRSAESSEIKAWYMLVASESMGYEKERSLTDSEFFEDIKRLKKHLKEAGKNPEAFFKKAQEHVLEQAESTIKFGSDDKEKRAPRGEGFSSFVPMAIMGYTAGIVQDDEDVFVGARGAISDDLIESCGLKMRRGPDDKNPKKTVTFYTNSKGVDVVKKVHPGLLVILTKSFTLAEEIVKVIHDEKDAIQIAEDALTHTRVIQTSEKNRQETINLDAERKHWERKQFLRVSRRTPIQEVTPKTKAMTRPREEFYDRMLYIRAMFVYFDALKVERDRLEERGQKRDITEHEREITGKETWDKMAQKVDELRHVNDLIAAHPEMMPKNIHSVVDMAGGAGDLGLAIGSDLMAQGRDIQDIEIVDPQEGTGDFMDNIVDYLPFREKLEKVAHHNDGYLQDAHIRPDAAVVAKHACGTLTDDTIKLWVKSESPVLVAMTCCQDKAAGHHAPYGFSQTKWDELCMLSAKTNTRVPEKAGPARDLALRELKAGKDAMFQLDMARVEELRRLGFKADLYTTDKFPKGDVIMARRLPKSFLDKVEEFKQLEQDAPLEFDAMMRKLDKMARGGDVRGERVSVFGKEWADDDFRELVRRLSPDEVARQKEVKERRAKQAIVEYEEKKALKAKKTAEEKAQAEKKAARQKREELMIQVFPEADGKPDVYLRQRSEQMGKAIVKKDYGKIMKIIGEVIADSSDQDPQGIRKKIEKMLDAMGN